MSTHLHTAFAHGGIEYRLEETVSPVRAWDGGKFGGRVLYSSRESKWSAGTGWKYATRAEACAAAQESAVAWYRHLIEQAAEFEADAIARGLNLRQLRGEA